MKILSVKDSAFSKYGRIIEHIDCSGLVKVLKNIPIAECIVYEPSVQSLEELPVMDKLSNIFFGEMPIQIGYCNGHNSRLNAVEYHRSSEVNVAATDVILLLGLQQDIGEDYIYDTSHMEAFLIPEGTAVELYATTLHYAPCGVDGAGFQVGVVLPKGTNGPLTKKHDMDGQMVSSEDSLLNAVNKWLIGHEEGGLNAGTFIGLKGANLDVTEA